MRTALYLGMAKTLPEGMDTITAQRDTSSGTLHPRSILPISRYLTAAESQSDLQAAFKYYNDDDHGTVPLIATYDALHFIFKDYRLTFKETFINDSSFKLAAYLQGYYEAIRSKYGVTSADGSALLPSEDWINNLGYYVLDKKQLTKAEELFKLNIKNYPNSFRAYTALGDLYTARNDNANAKANYKKSLALKDTTETRQKLEKLGRR